LIRKVIEVSNADLQSPMGDSTLGNALLAPTRLYVKSLLALLKEIDVHALAHITGGGLTENIPRVLPENSNAIISQSAWQMPEVFTWLQKNGNIAESEMLRTFNCGIGMVVCISADQAAAATQLLEAQGETVYSLGSIEASDNAIAEVVYRA